MYAITKEFTFSASHQLRGLPDEHQCSRMHGHNYIVKVEISAPMLAAPGFVIDYNELDSFKQYIDSKFDHRHLNSVLYSEDDQEINPTAENLARFFYYVLRDGEVGDKLRELHDNAFWITVHVSETPKTWASYDSEADEEWS